MKSENNPYNLINNQISEPSQQIENKEDSLFRELKNLSMNQSEANTNNQLIAENNSFFKNEEIVANNMMKKPSIKQSEKQEQSNNEDSAFDFDSVDMLDSSINESQKSQLSNYLKSNNKEKSVFGSEMNKNKQKEKFSKKESGYSQDDFEDFNEDSFFDVDEFNRL